MLAPYGAERQQDEDHEQCVNHSPTVSPAPGGPARLNIRACFGQVDAQTARHTRCIPSPACGGGLGWGACTRRLVSVRPPHPSPPPQAGEGADRVCRSTCSPLLEKSSNVRRRCWDASLRPL